MYAIIFIITYYKFMPIELYTFSVMQCVCPHAIISMHPSILFNNRMTHVYAYAWYLLRFQITNGSRKLNRLQEGNLSGVMATTFSKLKRAPNFNLNLKY